MLEAKLRGVGGPLLRRGHLASDEQRLCATVVIRAESFEVDEGLGRVVRRDAGSECDLPDRDRLSDLGVWVHGDVPSRGVQDRKEKERPSV